MWARFSFLNEIPGGYFGDICKAHDNEADIDVAIKTIKLKSRGSNYHKRIFREISVMKHLRSRFTVSLLHAEKIVEEGVLIKVQLVMPFLDYDLRRVTKKYYLRYIQIIQIMFQILMALRYLYEAEIIHRDLKPENIGINNNLDIKLLDFGLAREINGDMTEYVVTRWYRPIEVFATTLYTRAVDMWSAGCIFAELFLKKIIFKGKSQNDQIIKIIELTGMPDRTMLSRITDENSIEGLYLFESQASRTNILENFIKAGIDLFVKDEERIDPSCSNLVVKLICDMLDLNPNRRITPKIAVLSPLFELHKSNIESYLVDDKAALFIGVPNMNEETIKSLESKIIKEIDQFALQS